MAQNLHHYARLAIVPRLIGALLELASKRCGIKAMREFGQWKCTIASNSSTPWT